MSKAGVPIHVLGENASLFGGEADLILRAAPRVPYREYLSSICRGGYRFGLIPVSDDEYSRCKSPIKAIEFLDAGMKVFASDIAPYRDFARDHASVDRIETEFSHAKMRQELGKIVSVDPKHLGSEIRER